MVLKGEVWSLVSPHYAPAQQAELLSHSLLLPQPSLGQCQPLLGHLCWPKGIQGSFWASLCSQEGAVRWGIGTNTFPQPAHPTDGLGGCRALPCPAHPWLQLSFEPQCQTGECSPAQTRGKEGCSCEIFFSFFMWVAGRLWWSWRNSSGFREERKLDIFPPSLRKSNLRKFIHDQHTAIAHNFVNGNLVIHNTCVGDICSGVIQY